MSGGGHDAGDATVPAVMLLQCPAVSTQFGVISVPVQRNGPKVISATAGYSPGLASFPPTTADDGAAAAASSTAETRRKTLMKPGTTPPTETCICDMRHTPLAAWTWRVDCGHARRAASRATPSEDAPDGWLVDAHGAVPGALPRALREALHRAAAAEPAVRAPGGRGGRARDVHRIARGPSSRPGGEDPRARRRRELGDFARRARPPQPAQAHAAGVPRREDAAPLGADAGGDGARAGTLAARRAADPPPAPSGADARDHPARRVRAAGGRATRRAARTSHAHPRIRG